MIEPINNKDFYSLARRLDALTVDNVGIIIIELAQKLFNKTAIDNWFNIKGVKNENVQNKPNRPIMPVNPLVTYFNV
jgi:hypothetical protein